MTALNIWNRALAVIGAPRVSSTTETSSQKTLIDDHWAGVRQDWVCLHPWDGCTTVANLVENVSVTKPSRWGKAYDLPADFVMGWRLNNQSNGEGPQPLWEIMALPAEGTPVKKLFTDKTAAKLEYGFDPSTDVLIGLLNGTAVTSLVYRLAVTMARPWGKKEQDIRVLQAEAQEALYEAKLANGRQQKMKFGREKPLVDARSANL